MAVESPKADVREVAAADAARTSVCVLRKARPAMASVHSFTDWVDHRQRPEAYRVVGAFLPGNKILRPFSFVFGIGRHAADGEIAGTPKCL